MPDEVLILENNCMLIYAELLTPTKGDFPISPYYVFVTVHSLIKTQKSETRKAPSTSGPRLSWSSSETSA